MDDPAGSPSGRTFRIGIAVEHTVGHVAYAQLLREAVDRDPEVDATWFLLDPRPHGRLENLPVIRSNYSAYTGLRLWRSARRVEDELDALLLHTQTIGLYCHRLMHRVPTVISTDATPLNIDEVATSYRHRVGSWVEEEVKKQLVGRTFRAAAQVLPWNRWAERSLVDHYRVPSARITVQPPGLNIDRWQHQARRSSQGFVRLLFVGGDFDRKGGRLLLDALAQMPAVDWQLTVVTKSPVEPTERVQVISDIEPADPRLEQLYGEADIFVMPTDGDAHPFAIVEALAAGLPVVSTSVGALPEIVRDGETGFLVPPGDREQLRSRLEALVTDHELRQRMGDRAAADVRERFEGVTNGQRVLDLLKAVARPSARGRRGRAV